MIDDISGVKIKATTVEAILGAVHLEGGEVALGRAMEKLGLIDHAVLQARENTISPGLFKVPLLDNYLEQTSASSPSILAKGVASSRGKLATTLSISS